MNRSSTMIDPTSAIVRNAHETRCNPTSAPVPGFFHRAKTKPQLLSQLGFRNLILTMTYSHMGKPHTTIGDASFH
ncbi:hypothetical protein J4P02_30105, partial [Pseudomonas sp. NFXW11]|uniref:hypothetical protein n=1 Tax=Pseudomonas sp. NFXW11 TaxID=2819531 RepID=UPI003CE7F335